MALNNTITARIQLKNDTEANWKKATNFIPKQGEVIIYNNDDTHPFSRLKVGNGIQPINSLSFIDAGSVNGKILEEVIQVYNSKIEFPQVGEEYSLYVDLENSFLYCWTNNGGYSPIEGITYDTIKQTINTVTFWDAGEMTIAAVKHNELNIKNGTVPTLNLQEIEVVTDIKKHEVN